MEKLLDRLTWELIPLSIAALAAFYGQWLIVVLMVVVGGLAAAAKTRWVRKRVPFLRTQSMRLAEWYDSGYRLRKKLSEQAKARELESWETWHARATEWDGRFWAYIERSRDDALPLKRSVHTYPAEAYSNWVDAMRTALEERLTLIKRLMDEAAR